MAEPTNCLEFENSSQWMSWLEINHTTETEAWLIIYKKKYQDHGLALDAAVEAALCFGWIDGSLRKVDQKRFALRFSPRNPNSVWSIRNIKRAQRLISEGKMMDSGMAKIAEAKENGQWQAAIRREQVDRIPEELEQALRRKEGALSAYKALPDSRKKRYIYWLQSAKREDTKRKRIQKITDEVLGN
jgi:uncharacterized protein YdeI (YjbR/CyaY-like superfamily)